MEHRVPWFATAVKTKQKKTLLTKKNSLVKKKKINMSFFPRVFDVDVLLDIVFDYLWIYQKELWVSQSVSIKNLPFLIWFLKWFKQIHVSCAQTIYLMGDVDVIRNIPHKRIYDDELSTTHFLQHSSVRSFHAFINSSDEIVLRRFIFDSLRCCTNENKRCLLICKMHKNTLNSLFLRYQPGLDRDLLMSLSTYVSDSTLVEYIRKHGFTIAADLLRSWLPRILTFKLPIQYPSFPAMRMGHTSTETLLLFKAMNWIDPQENVSFFWRAVKANDVNAALYFFQPSMLKQKESSFLNWNLTFEMLNCFLDFLDDIKDISTYSFLYQSNDSSRTIIHELMDKLNRREGCKPKDFMSLRWTYAKQELIFDWFCEHDRHTLELAFHDPQILFSQLSYAILNLHDIVLQHVAILVNLAFGFFNRVVYREQANLLLKHNIMNQNSYMVHVKQVARLGVHVDIFAQLWQKNQFYVRHHMTLIKYMCKKKYCDTLKFLLQTDIPIDANDLLSDLEIICNVGNISILQQMTNITSYAGNREDCYSQIRNVECIAYLWNVLPLSKTQLCANECRLFKHLCFQNMDAATFIWHQQIIDTPILFPHGLQPDFLRFARSVCFDLDFKDQQHVMQL